MNYSFLLFGILPLLTFVIIDAFLNIKAALISAIIIAIAEVIFSILVFQEIDSLTIFSLLSVIIFAFASYKMNNSIFIKFQPVVLSLIMGVILICSFLIDKPLLYEMSVKYEDFYPENIRQNLTNPLIISILKINTIGCGIALIVHSAITGYAAIKLSNWWWIAIRGIGFYLCLFTSILFIKLIYI